MTPQELKNSILQLAIQGKLVDQRPEEGTAEDLYQQIQDTINQEESGNRKGERKNGIVVISKGDLPFEIPESWKWVRLEEIGFTNIGLTYSPHNQTSEGTIVLRSSNIQDGKMDYADIVRVSMDIPKNKRCHIGDILICARNGSKRLVGKASIIDQEGMSFGAFMAIFRSICNSYVLHVINSAYFRNSLLGDTGTTTINQITQDMLKNALVPLPPLAEQKRIVAKIEELQPYIDRYEQAWSKLEDFKKRFPIDMQKSILQFAIQGKLVEQRPEEGTGEELYRQIQAEKQRLIKAGVIKADKPLPEIAEDEKPFDIPENWRWVRIAGICAILNGDRGKNYPSKDTLSKQGIPFISALNLDGKTVSTDDNLLFMSEEQYRKLGNGKLQQGDIVCCIRGSLGKHGRFPFDKGAIASSLVIMRLFQRLEDAAKYLMLYLDSQLFFDQIRRYDNGTAQPNLAARSLELFGIPLPPIAEQKRIVAKLEELLPLCEKLK